MDPYVLVITIIGIAALGMAWLPSVSRRTQISYVIFYVLFGMAVFSVFRDFLPWANPMTHPEITIHLTELVVIISLMGSGLKIDQPFSFLRAYSPWNLM